MHCYILKLFLPANLDKNGNTILELKAKQDSRTQLLLYLKLKARKLAKIIKVNYEILSIKQIFLCIAKSKIKISYFVK